MLAFIIRIYHECQKKKRSKWFRYILHEVCGPVKKIILLKFGCLIYFTK